LKGQGVSIFNSIPYMELIPISFQKPSFFPIPCKVPWRRIHIFSNGDVSLCQVMEKKGIIGNCRGKYLHHLWYSHLAKNIRKIVGNRKCGGCWLSCYQETNIRFSSVYGYRVLFNSFKRYIGL
jgi:MoaA/NifB/PqqE/SkfB family radical SAM enzyme